MTREQLLDTMLELIIDLQIEEQHEIISELKVLADENWESICDAAWEMYSFGI